MLNLINNQQIIPKLKYVTFNDNVKATLNIQDLGMVDFLFIALPSQNIREVLSKYSIENKNLQIIIASKGIEI